MERRWLVLKKVIINIILLLVVFEAIFMIYNGQKLQAYFTSYHAEKVIKIGTKYSKELIAISELMEGKENNAESKSELKEMWEKVRLQSEEKSEVFVVFDKLNCKPVVSWQWETGNIEYYYSTYCNKYTGEDFFYGFRYFPNCSEQPKVDEYIREADGRCYYYTRISGNLYAYESAFFGV